MRIITFSAVVLTLLGYEALPAAASSGSFFGALDLAELCSNDKKSSGYGSCVGYIAYFEANPDVLEEDAEDIGIEMLEARYPC